MKNNGDRDRGLDAALRAVGRPDRTTAPDLCPDAERLAAYADAELGAVDRANAERHFAGCARCQATLAAMVRGDLAGAGVEQPRAWLPKWVLVTVGSLAATIVLGVWISIGKSSIDAARTKSAGAQAEAIARQDDLGVAGTGQEDRQADLLSKDIASLAVTPPAQAPNGNSPQPAGVSPLSNTTLVASADPDAAMRARALESMKEATRDEAAPAPLSPPESLETAGGTPAAASPSAPASAPVPAPAPPPPAVLAGSARSPQSAPTTAAGSAGYQSQSRQSAAAKTEMPTDLISEPEGGLWRILPDGVVSYSADGGASWVVQLNESGVEFRAGASPSRSVSWIVGRDGAVRRTTNGGRTWDSVNVPERVLLMRVNARDADNATVAALDGKTFTTSDGGRKWEEN